MEPYPSRARPPDEADRLFDIYRRSDVVRWIGAEPMQDGREAIELIERNLMRLKRGFADRLREVWR